MSSWILLLFVLLISSFLLLVSATGNESDRSRGVKVETGDEDITEKDKRQFYVGSRYGRSQSDMSTMDDNEGEDFSRRIVQRNEKFFLGSRYGKRFSTFEAFDKDRQERMKCFYTGVSNFFRCLATGKTN